MRDPLQKLWEQIAQLRLEQARQMSLLRRQVPRLTTIQDLARQQERR